MSGSLATLSLAMLAFVGGHILFAGTPLRAMLVDLVGGEARFRGVFSLYSAVTLIWVVMAYSNAPYAMLWPDAHWLRAIPLLLMPIACILIVAGLSTPNPTAVGGERTAESASPVTGILRVTRHPFLWGVGLWALAHGAANGDVASLTLFGGMAVMAFGGMPSIDAKLSRRLGAAWAPIALTTSIVPFLAIARGQNRFVFREIGWLRVAGGLALYALLILAHPLITGKPVFF